MQFSAVNLEKLVNKVINQYKTSDPCYFNCYSSGVGDFVIKYKNQECMSVGLLVRQGTDILENLSVCYHNSEVVLHDFLKNENLEMGDKNFASEMDLVQRNFALYNDDHFYNYNFDVEVLPIVEEKEKSGSVPSWKKWVLYGSLVAMLLAGSQLPSWCEGNSNVNIESVDTP